MHHRRLSVLVAALVAALACSTAALAAAAHPHHVSGRVLSINVKRHTLRLRVNHGAKARTAAAHAAAAGGPVVTIGFGQASVSGPNGAVEVGDEVTVTTQPPAGSGPAVATAIQVIGQPNGGTGGKGAAVPGVVAAVDAADGQLTLAVMSTDAQGDAQPSAVIVTVGSSTILAVADTNGDHAVTLADVAVGDHVVVFTTDATANPIAAVGILDASNAGGNHEGGGDGPRRIPIPGTVVSVDPGSSTLVITPFADGHFAGQQVTVTVTPQTSFGGDGGDGRFSLNDVGQGDRVVVYAAAPPSNGAVVALGVVDESSHGAPQRPVPDGQVLRFGGTVTQVRGDGLTVQVTSGGPLSGQTVIVAIRDSTRFETGQGSATGLDNLHNIAVGDAVEIFTASETGTPVVALGVVDDSVVTGSQGGSGDQGGGQAD